MARWTHRFDNAHHNLTNDWRIALTCAIPVLHIWQSLWYQIECVGLKAGVYVGP